MDVVLRYDYDGCVVTLRVASVPATKRVRALRKAFLRAFASKHPNESAPIVGGLRYNGAPLDEDATVGAALPAGDAPRAIDVAWAPPPEELAAAAKDPMAAAADAAKAGRDAHGRGDYRRALQSYAAAAAALRGARRRATRRPPCFLGDGRISVETSSSVGSL